MAFPFCQDSTYNLFLFNGNLSLGFLKVVSFSSTQFCYKHVTHTSYILLEPSPEIGVELVGHNIWIAQKEENALLPNSIKFPIIQIFSVCLSLLDSWEGSACPDTAMWSTLVTWCPWSPIFVLRRLHGVRSHLHLSNFLNHVLYSVGAAGSSSWLFLWMDYLRSAGVVRHTHTIL